MSKFADIIGEARKPEHQNASKPENQETTKSDYQKSGKQDQEKAKKELQVNITVKVAESKRNHWAAEAKRKRKTLTEVITKALSQEFGEPTD